jgi:hypothetical protein
LVEGKENLTTDGTNEHRWGKNFKQETERAEIGRKRTQNRKQKENEDQPQIKH